MTDTAPFRVKPTYSTGDVARLLGVPTRRVVRACQAGGLKHHLTQGHYRRIAHADLVVWLQSEPAEYATALAVAGAALARQTGRRPRREKGRGGPGEPS